MDTEVQLFAGAAGVLATFVGMKIAAAAYNRIAPPRTPAVKCVSECSESVSLSRSPSPANETGEGSPAVMTKSLVKEFEETKEEMEIENVSQQFEEITVKEENSGDQRVDKEAAPKRVLRKTRLSKAEAPAASPPTAPVGGSQADVKITRSKGTAKKSNAVDVQKTTKEADDMAVEPAAPANTRRTRRNKENAEPTGAAMEVDLEPIVDVEVEMRQPLVAKSQKPTQKKGNSSPDSAEEEQRPSFCKLIDRNVEKMSIERHRTLLASSTSLSVRTLQNLVRGSVEHVPSEQAELIEVYLALFHAAADTPPRKPPPKKRGSSAAAPEDSTPSPPKRSRRTPLKTTQPAAPVPGKSPRSKGGKAAPRESKAAAAARVELVAGEEVEVERGRFRVQGVLAAGADSKVYRGACVAGRHAGAAVAIKVQPRHCKTIFQITTEHHVLQRLAAHQEQHTDPHLRVQAPLAYGCHNDACYVLVTRLLGPTLLALLPPGDQGGVGAANTLLAAWQGLRVLESVHAAGYVHRDVKPENLAVSHAGRGAALHLIDFGTAEALVDRNGHRKTQAQAQEGSLPYMASTTHERAPLGKRDDVEGLLWTLLRLGGALPWGALKQPAQVAKAKREWLAGARDTSHLDARVAKVLAGIAKHVAALGPEDDPDYEGLRALVKKSWQGTFPSPAAAAYEFP